MAYIRIKPSKDTFISEKYDEYNFGRDSQLFIGSTFYNNDITNEYDAVKYRTRSLIAFDLSDYVSLSSLTGSLTCNLILWDNTNIFEHKEDEPFYVDVFAASLDWMEGVGYEDHNFGSFNMLNDTVLRINAPMVSNWNVRNKYNQNWSGSAVSGSTVSVTGGAWFPSISATQQVWGYEHLAVNVTDIFSKWINGEIDNNGFLIKLADEWEMPSDYATTGINYFKQFTSRHSKTVYRPYLEIIYDTKLSDDRGCFYKNSSQNLFLYNFLNGKLTDLDGTNAFPGTVSISEYGSTAALTSGLHASRFSQGVYFTSYIYTGSASRLIDTWTVTSSASAMFSSITSDVTVKQTYSYDSMYNTDERIQAINFLNMQNTYKKGTIFNLRILFISPWTSKQTLTAFYESRVSNVRIMKEAWISLVDLEMGIVFIPPRPINYDSKGNWIEIDTNLLEGNRRYVPILYYYEQGQLQRKIYNEYSFFVR
jgi:hypothetical protein